MPPLNFSTVLSWNTKKWNDLFLELKHTISATQNRYPDYDFTSSIVQNGNLVPVEVPLSKPPKGFQLLHFYSEIKPKVFKKIETVFTFSIDNVLNTSYREYLNKFRFYADEMGRNFRVQLKFNY
jgi:iron complex outermembrane recepter protein